MTARDLVPGAWFVETLIVALILLLVGQAFGLPISTRSFLEAAVLAVIIMLCVEPLRRRFRMPD